MNSDVPLNETDLASVRVGLPDAATLVNSRGIAYAEFKRTLTPRYWIVWTHIGLGYLALGFFVALIIATQIYAKSYLPLAIAAGAMGIGYFIAYLLLFLHEAAHYNLARDRRSNDVLANLFIGILIAQDIREYRPFHFTHHRKLGTPEDTENAYFDALSVKFIFESIFLIRPLKVMLKRSTHGQKKAAVASPLQKLAGLALNAAIVAIAIALGFWPVALAWAVGVVMVFPFFAALRPILEHRGFHADHSVDYAKVPHGPVNRLFGSGPIASTLGGAGFNRHLLHHWEPQISYTRLKDLERFLMDCPAASAPDLDQYRTTYARAFLTLLNR